MGVTLVPEVGATSGGPSLNSVDSLGTTGADVNVGLAAPPTTGQVLTATSATTATWQTPVSTEDIQDIVGAMVSGNTETSIAVTYDDTLGKLDFVVSSSLTGFTGASNTGLGTGSGDSVTSGAANTSVGVNSLTANSTGSNNTAFGHSALLGNTATGNTAFGYGTLATNIGGSGNVAVGTSALTSNSSGSFGTAVGQNSLFNSTANGNTALGYDAGNIITSGTNNTLLGYDADANSATASNRTVIGKGALGTVDNSVTLGNTSVTAIYMGSTANKVAMVPTFDSSQTNLYTNTAISGTGVTNITLSNALLTGKTGAWLEIRAKVKTLSSGAAGTTGAISVYPGDGVTYYAGAFTNQATVAATGIVVPTPLNTYQISVPFFVPVIGGEIDIEFDASGSFSTGDLIINLVATI